MTKSIFIDPLTPKALRLISKRLESDDMVESTVLNNASQEILYLRTFASYVLNDSFQGYDTDGGGAQDLAESLGLIELRPCKPEESIDGEIRHFFLAWDSK